MWAYVFLFLSRYYKTALFSIFNMSLSKPYRFSELISVPTTIGNSPGFHIMVFIGHYSVFCAKRPSRVGLYNVIITISDSTIVVCAWNYYCCKEVGNIVVAPLFYNVLYGRNYPTLHKFSSWYLFCSARCKNGGAIMLLPTSVALNRTACDMVPK